MATEPRATERWHRIASVFEASLDVPAGQRAAFIDSACGADTALKAEVLALLARHDQSDGFLEPPAMSPRASSLVGETRGPYEFLGRLGSGGMGVVYEARDTTLGRRVAIKMLPPEFAHDPARRLRLHQEARAAASLAHPGIATVYKLEEFGDDLFIVSELVQGHTLRTELQHGALALPRVLAVGRQMAAALAAAHARGVVHRDIKPENVMITDEDVVKLIDFGLARIADEGGPTRESLTQSGVMIGTVAYMAPEQVRAQPTTFRTDLFEFGVVLYECITGHNPFAGGDIPSTLAHIVEAEPVPLTASVKGDSRALVLQPIVDQCLRKDPELRYRSTGDLVRDLELVGRIVEQGTGERLTSSGFESRARSDGLWWWQFHQLVVCGLDCVMLLLGWFVQWKAPFPPVARAMFFAALAAGVVDVALRAHLLFTSRVSPGELAGQISRVGPWTRGMHALFLAILLAAAFALLVADRPGTAVAFFIAAVAGGVSFLVIEPTRRPG